MPAASTELAAEIEVDDLLEPVVSAWNLDPVVPAPKPVVLATNANHEAAPAGAAPEENSLHGWALARNAFLSKSKADAVDVWQAVVKDARAAAQRETQAAQATAAPVATPNETEAAAALRAFRATRGRTTTLERLSATALRTLRTRFTKEDTSPASSRPGSAKKQSKSLKELLLRDVRPGVDHKFGFFGLIRFPAAARAIPSKFVRLASTHNFADADEATHYSKHIVELALATWKVREATTAFHRSFHLLLSHAFSRLLSRRQCAQLSPPCAMISLLHAGHRSIGDAGGGGRMQALHVNSQLELVVRRGVRALVSISRPLG